MKRATTISLLALVLMQIGCGNSSALWGTRPTPTAMLIFPTPPPLRPPTVSVPTETLVATRAAPPATAPFTPIPRESFFTPTTASGSSFTEVTRTPTSNTAPILYYAQSGDTLSALAKRFNVSETDITSSESFDTRGLIIPGTLLVIPRRIMDATTPNIQIVPDSEIIFAASALDFDYGAFIKQQGGYLSKHNEFLNTGGWTDGQKMIERLAYENSINPRILLAVLEYESRWVSGDPIDALHTDYPMGFVDIRYKSAFMQMVWAVNQLSIGYYGWRDGSVTSLRFSDGTTLRLDPNLNAGTVAIQYLFSRLHSQSQWSQIINPTTGFPALYVKMFGDPWARAELVDPIFPVGLSQPPMILPFEPKVEWSYTGGPHGAWEHDGALAAIDFAPATDHGGCEETPTWVVASAPGLVVRSGNGVVIIDMDGDGYEQTGWTLLYLHVATKDRIRVGTWVDTDDRLGHASCEGGKSTGTHLHFARKYNGEWIPATGPIPFVVGGWIAQAGDKPYEGKLIRGDQVITADPVGQAWSVIFRDPDVAPAPKP